MNRFLFLLLFLAGTQSYAQSYRYQFTLRDDNDFYFAGDDRYYTNGTFLGVKWASADSLNTKKRAVKSVWQVHIGQKMFNPQSGFIPAPRFIDRPFAGYLFAGLAHTKVYKNESRLRIDLEGGVIGPDALGMETQRFIHKLIGQYPPMGWQYQIGNEVALNSVFQYSRPLLKNTARILDLSAEGTGLLGTTFSGARASVFFRAGALKPFTKSASYGTDVGAGAGEKEFYFYTRPELGWVAFDATLEGTLFTHTKSNAVTVDVNRFFYSQTFGGVYSKNRWLVDFSLLFRTKESPEQVRTVHWAALSLGYRFGKK